MMSEIKFACPHCNQHIACDSAYADLSIDCPSCGKPMVVPRLSGAEPKDSGMVVVASTSRAAPPVLSRPPVVKARTEEEWARRAGPSETGAEGAVTAWMGAALATLIIAAILRSHSMGSAVIFVWVIVGSIITGILLAKGGTKGVRGILKGFGLMLAAIIVLPLLALSILFIGCTACH